MKLLETFLILVLVVGSSISQAEGYSACVRRLESEAQRDENGNLPRSLSYFIDLRCKIQNTERKFERPTAPSSNCSEGDKFCVSDQNKGALKTLAMASCATIDENAQPTFWNPRRPSRRISDQEAEKLLTCFKTHYGRSLKKYKCLANDQNFTGAANGLHMYCTRQQNIECWEGFHDAVSADRFGKRVYVFKRLDGYDVNFHRGREDRWDYLELKLTDTRYFFDLKQRCGLSEQEPRSAEQPDSGSPASR